MLEGKAVKGASVPAGALHLLSVSERHLVCHPLIAFCSSKRNRLKTAATQKGSERRRFSKDFRLALDYLEKTGNIFLELETELHFSCVKLCVCVCVCRWGGMPCLSLSTCQWNANSRWRLVSQRL